MLYSLFIYYFCARKLVSMDGLSVIKAPISKEMEIFDKLFDDSLVSDNVLLNSVFSHIRKRKGKLMRPQLFMLTGKLFDNVDIRGMHAALALELLHTASLVHDDVVDGSSMRRGQPSVNSIYDNKRAVLSGDYILATALKHAAMSGNLRVVDVISELGQALAEGEVLQLEKSVSEDIDEDAYMAVIAKKTAALFSSCTRCAALVCGASHDMVDRMTRFGHCLGMAFQIRDDIFDYFPDAEIGKPTGNDMREGKITLPAIYALRKCGNSHTAELLRAVKSGEATPAEVEELVNFARENSGIEYAVKMMDSFHDKALEMLDFVNDGSLKDALTAYAGFVVKRNF